MSKQDNWEKAKDRYPVGKVVEATVVHNEPFGVFLELPDGTKGLIELPEISDKKPLASDEIPQPGDIVKAQVLGHRDNRETVFRQVLLSIRALNES